MSSETEEAPRELSAELVAALHQVANVHNGEVPLHGRLFAQWLHYAFPHECPYPHVTGKINPLTPSEWFKMKGRGTDASVAEVAQTMRIAGNETSFGSGVNMSQWTLDEEMRTDYSAPAVKDSVDSEEGQAMSFTMLQALKVLSF